MAIQVRKRYTTRIKNSIVGALFGGVLFLGSFVGLSWNERDAVRQTGAITEIDRVATADVSSESVQDVNEGKLIHVSGEAATQEELEFRQFGVRENAIRLRWDSSIYQWEEERKERDDRTTYDYHQRWVDRPINSTGFRDSSYSNDGSTKHFQDGSEQADLVSLGAFRLSDELIDQIRAEDPLPLPESIAMDIQPSGQVHDGIFYTGNPSQPQIGDERVEVFVVGPRHEVTVMAQQSGNSFREYQTKVGIPKQILYLGRLSKAEVISKQRTAVALKRWIIRAVGFAAMWIGLMLVFSPLKAFISFVPFVNRIVGGAVGLVTFLIAVCLSSITIAIAWVAVRPLLSVTLLVLAAASVYLLAKKSARREVSRESPTPPPLPGM